MSQRDMDDFMSVIIARVNRKNTIDNIISIIMNPENRIQPRRKIVIINKIKSAILTSILERQNKIKTRYCI